MSTNQVLLVKHSWSFVSGELSDLCQVFTKQLARLQPELKPLLQKLSHEQKLFETMTTVNQLVNSLPELSKAERNVILLVASYSDISISRDNYDTALIAFLMALEKKIGRNWNTNTRDAWIFTFVSIYQHFKTQLEKPIRLIKGPRLTDKAA